MCRNRSLGEKVEYFCLETKLKMNGGGMDSSLWGLYAPQFLGISYSGIGGR